LDWNMPSGYFPPLPSFSRLLSLFLLCQNWRKNYARLEREVAMDIDFLLIVPLLLPFLSPMLPREVIWSSGPPEILPLVRLFPFPIAFFFFPFFRKGVKQWQDIEQSAEQPLFPYFLFVTLSFSFFFLSPDRINRIAREEHFLPTTSPFLFFFPSLSTYNEDFVGSNNKSEQTLYFRDFSFFFFFFPFSPWAGLPRLPDAPAFSLILESFGPRPFPFFFVLTKHFPPFLPLFSPPSLPQACGMPLPGNKMRFARCSLSFFLFPTSYPIM